MPATLTVVGGLVVTPEGLREADVVVEDGTITATSQPGAARGQTVDVSGCVVLPGGVDPHTHLMADIAAGTAAALRGGTTTALSFTAPRPSEPAAAAFVRARDELIPLAAVDVRLHPSIWEPDRLSPEVLAELAALGARSVKLFLAYPELGLMASDRVLYETLRVGHRLGLLVQVHCENGGAIAARVDEFLAAGRKDVRAFVETRPPGVEEEAVGRTLALAALAEAPVYLVHLSTAGSLDLVRAARHRGQAVFAEACTHHLLFDSDVYLDPNAERFLVVPPLRGREHVEALWEGVADGTLDAIGSDHAQEPYRPDVPPGDFRSHPYGLAGVEERLPFVLAEGRRRGIPLERLVELLCAGPARIFGLRGRKGAIETGADADLVAWDPEGESIGESGPYSGTSVPGGIRLVLQRGAAPGMKAPEPPQIARRSIDD
jgi:dihydropyrimidinase